MIPACEDSVHPLELRDVTYDYDEDAAPVLQEISFLVELGEWVHITGDSGSGKSTLAQLLCGYLPRTGGGVRSGLIDVNGIDPGEEGGIRQVTERIGVVFQDPDAQLVQGCVEDEIAFGPENMRCDIQEIERRVVEALDAVDLRDYRMDNVHRLSGGQRQRAAIAAVLSLETPILVLDEPAASLDAAAKEQLLLLLNKLQRQGRTIVTLSGRIDEFAAGAGRLIVLEQGKITLDGPSQHLLEQERVSLIKLGLLPDRIQCEGYASSILEAEGQPQIVSSVKPLLEIKDLSYAYDLNKGDVLKNINLSLYAGEWRLLCGENGSGKTTLSRLFMGLLTPPKGKIWWQGQDIARLTLPVIAQDIGYVFQQPEHQFVANTVLDELLFGPRAAMRLKPRDQTPDPVLKRAEALLAIAGLQGREHISPYMLSGGEKRLLSVAAAMIVPKKLYILDEP
ncbi:MAG TPA: energy-coupling factor transporter ATPase, partial [Paenibacillus sp.]